MAFELVLGGSGLIGNELCRQLAKSGSDIINLDLCRPETEHARVRTHSVNLATDDPILWHSISSSKRVWFCAWDCGGANYLQNEWHAIYERNCRLMSTVFGELKRYADKTGRHIPVCFLSSYWAESNTPYGLTKRIGEDWAMRLQAHVVRLWNVYGWEVPNGNRNHLIPHLIAGVRDSGRIRLQTTGLESRQFLYKSDCVAALRRLMEHPPAYFHLSDGEWVTVASVAEELRRQMKVKRSVIRGKKMGTNMRYEALVTGLDGWKPKISLAQGIRLTLEDSRKYYANHDNKGE